MLISRTPLIGGHRVNTGVSWSACVTVDRNQDVPRNAKDLFELVSKQFHCSTTTTTCQNVGNVPELSASEMMYEEQMGQLMVYFRCVCAAECQAARPCLLFKPFRIQDPLKPTVGFFFLAPK